MRKALLRLVLLALAAVLSPAAARAQACLGLPSFAGGSVHLNGSLELPDSATSYGIAVSGGSHNHLFANLGGGQVSYAGQSHKATLGFLEIGLQVPLRSAQLCPVAGGYLAAGPDDPEVGLTSTSRAAVAGLALGLPVGPRAFRLVPNVAVKYQYVWQKVQQEEIGTLSEPIGSGVVDLGLGLVVADRLGIQPLVHIPFAAEGQTTSWGVFASVSVGRRGP